MVRIDAQQQRRRQEQQQYRNPTLDEHEWANKGTSGGAIHGEKKVNKGTTGKHDGPGKSP